MQVVSSALKEKLIHITNTISNVCDLEWILSRDQQPIPLFRNRISLVDLYCGCGGMSLGVKEALRVNNYSLDIKLALDIDKEALNVYKRNFSVDDEIALNADIKKFVSRNIGKPFNAIESSLRERYKNVDLLVAGPPCQGHSNLNNHTRRDDPRNNLYLNAIRFVEILMPKVAIIENVSTVIHDKDRVVDKARLALEKVGYKIYSLIIDTSDFGLAQTRKRHLQIALLNTDISINLSNYLMVQPLPLSHY